MFSTSEIGNNYRLNCPVTGRDNQLLVVCGNRIAKQWRGEQIPDRDCSCAMNAGKCPARVMQQMERTRGRMLFVERAMGPAHRLHKAIADRIEKIIILPSHAAQAGLDMMNFARMAINGLMPEKGESHNDPEYVAPVERSATTSGRGRRGQRKVITQTPESGIEDAGSMATMLNKSLESQE